MAEGQRTRAADSARFGRDNILIWQIALVAGLLATWEMAGRLTGADPRRVREVARTADVQGMCTYEDLVVATTKDVKVLRPNGDRGVIELVGGGRHSRDRLHQLQENARTSGYLLIAQKAAADSI